MSVIKRSPLEFIIKEHKEIYGSMPKVIASAPGRLDFLNTHQDYKGLPVVSVAINKRTYLAISESNNKSTVVSLNLREEGLPYADSFKVRELALSERGFFGNYVRSVIISLRERGFEVSNFEGVIYSEIPVASGLASSAALQVSLITALNELYGFGLSKGEIAELAYHSEHNVMGIPCGRLDQYGSVMGGITRINTKPPYDTKTYAGYDWYFVVLYSGIKHSTASIHPRRISEIESALRKLQSVKLPEATMKKLSNVIDEVRWNELSLNEIEPFLSVLEPAERNRFIFTIKMNESTKLALDLLENPWAPRIVENLRSFLEEECFACLPIRGVYDVITLMAGIVNYQHVLLRDLYEVSIPELELIRTTALNSGALGVKISGAGMGGSLLALVDSRETAVEVLNKTKGIVKDNWIVEIDEGARVDYLRS